jgi:hypothetical protein
VCTSNGTPNLDINSLISLSAISFVNANASNWDLYVNLLLAAYRSSPHPATGFTPNLMMLGREINIPKNILLSECSTKEPEDTDDGLCVLLMAHQIWI